MTHPRERESLRALAVRWMAHAADPIMAERRRLWRAVKDLQMERPVILVETCMLPDYIGQDELVCQDPYLRNIEKSLLEIVRHADSGTTFYKISSGISCRFAWEATTRSTRIRAPAYISGPNPDWERAERDMRDTLAAARDCNLEICFRDIYTINGDRPRLARWEQMTRALACG